MNPILAAALPYLAPALIGLAAYLLTPLIRKGALWLVRWFSVEGNAPAADLTALVADAAEGVLAASAKGKDPTDALAHAKASVLATYALQKGRLLKDIEDEFGLLVEHRLRLAANMPPPTSPVVANLPKPGSGLVTLPLLLVMAAPLMLPIAILAAVVYLVRTGLRLWRESEVHPKVTRECRDVSGFVDPRLILPLCVFACVSIPVLAVYLLTRRAKTNREWKRGWMRGARGGFPDGTLLLLALCLLAPAARAQTASCSSGQVLDATSGLCVTPFHNGEFTHGPLASGYMLRWADPATGKPASSAFGGGLGYMFGWDFIEEDFGGLLGKKPLFTFGLGALANLATDAGQTLFSVGAGPAICVVGSLGCIVAVPDIVQDYGGDLTGWGVGRIGRQNMAVAITVGIQFGGSGELNTRASAPSVPTPAPAPPAVTAVPIRPPVFAAGTFPAAIVASPPAAVTSRPAPVLPAPAPTAKGSTPSTAGVGAPGGHRSYPTEAACWAAGNADCCLHAGTYGPCK